MIKDKKLDMVNLTVRIESNLKKDVHQILDSLGLNQSTVINMLYRQIVLNKKIPFEISLLDTHNKGKK